MWVPWRLSISKFNLLLSHEIRDSRVFGIESVVDIKEEDSGLVVGSDGAVDACAERLGSSSIRDVG